MTPTHLKLKIAPIQIKKQISDTLKKQDQTSQIKKTSLKSH